MIVLLFVLCSTFQGLSSAATLQERSSKGISKLRLNDGPDRCAGRVEILVHNQWGTICDDGWDLADAAVVCKELECGTAVRAPIEAAFGLGTGKIWLESVQCTGKESLLQDCRHPTFGNHNCQHREDASVVCSESRALLAGSFTVEPIEEKPKPESTTAPFEPGSVRLVNGRGRCSGRVEIFYNDMWGTVCDDLWNINSAKVICRQLNCGDAISAPLKAFFGRGTGVIWLDNIRCTGSEKYLEDCDSHKWGKNDCVHEEDAGVVCSESIADIEHENLTEQLEHVSVAPKREITQLPFDTEQSLHKELPNGPFPEKPNSPSDHYPHTFSEKKLFPEISPDKQHSYFDTPQLDSTSENVNNFNSKQFYPSTLPSERDTFSNYHTNTIPDEDIYKIITQRHFSDTPGAEPTKPSQTREAEPSSGVFTAAISLNSEGSLSDGDDFSHSQMHASKLPSNEVLSSSPEEKLCKCDKGVTSTAQDSAKLDPHFSKGVPEDSGLSPECASKIYIETCKSHQYPELLHILKEMRNEFGTLSATFQQGKQDVRSIADSLQHLTSSVQEMVKTFQLLIEHKKS